MSALIVSTPLMAVTPLALLVIATGVWLVYDTVRYSPLRPAPEPEPVVDLNGMRPQVPDQPIVEWQAIRPPVPARAIRTAAGWVPAPVDEWSDQQVTWRYWDILEGSGL